MRSPACGDRVASAPDGRPIIVTCVHGTWARGSRWPRVETAVREGLGGSEPVTFDYFDWSGRNSVAARSRAAADLRQHLLDQITRWPDASHILIAHSHGANVVLHALNGNLNSNGNPEPHSNLERNSNPEPHSNAERNSNAELNLNTNREPGTGNGEPGVSAIVFLSPPLLDCALVDEPTAASNQLLLASVALVPLVLTASRYVRVAFDISPVTQLTAVVALMVAWLMLFRPAAVRRRADAVAGQMALPRLDFPGLVVRAADDEATFALSSVNTIAGGARRLWARLFRTQAPFWSRDERRLREARTGPEVARAVFDILILVPMTIALLSVAHAAASDGRWGALAISLPLAMLLGTAALIVVGGALLTLLLVPACSVLLWPFGIRPTPASSLLNVSVEPAPGPSWHVVTVGKSGKRGWRHSLHEHPEALQCVGAYCRSTAANPEPRTRTGNREP